MGANIASEIAEGKFSEATVGNRSCIIENIYPNSVRVAFFLI
jgi:glycerol-3-phosphate dehydrogenase